MDVDAAPSATAPIADATATAEVTLLKINMTLQHDPIEQLARRRDAFVAWANARLPTPQDADDVVQQALERASQNVEQVDDPSATEAWFWQILRRTVADFYADRERDRRKIERFEQLAATEIPTEPAADAGVCPCSLAELDNLSPNLRDAVVRIDLHDESATEAAHALEISPGAARVRAHRGRKELRRRIEERCQVSTVQECLDCAC